MSMYGDCRVFTPVYSVQCVIYVCILRSSTYSVLCAVLLRLALSPPSSTSSGSRRRYEASAAYVTTSRHRINAPQPNEVWWKKKSKRNRRTATSIARGCRYLLLLWTIPHSLAFLHSHIGSYLHTVQRRIAICPR